MKKVIKLTESDLERIVRRVIEEQYVGVAFGGEQNGLKIKKVEATEQVKQSGTPTKPDSVAAKPSFENNGVAYYVPGLDGKKFQDFFSPPPFSDYMTFIKTMNNLGFTWAGKGVSPFGYPAETYQKQMDNMISKDVLGGSYVSKNNAPILIQVDNIRDLLSKVNDAYLRNWSPSTKGVAVLTNPKFLQDPSVVQLKKNVKNFDEFYPKLLNYLSKGTGLQLA